MKTQRSNFAMGVAAAVILGGISGMERARAATDSAFTDEVAPVLVERCLVCHGGDAIEGDFDLSTVGGISESGASGEPSVVPGHSAESELFRRLVTEDQAERMPADGPPLSDEEIEAIRQWIDGGAKTGQLDNATPLADAARRDRMWVDHPVDYPRPLPVVALDWSGKEDAILISGGYGELLLWDAASGDLRARIGGLAPYIAAIVGGENYVLVSHGVPGAVGYVTRIALDEHQETGRRELATTSDVEGAIAISPDGRRVAIGRRDGIVEITRMEDGQIVTRMNPHADAVLDVAFTESGQHLLTASRDRTARAIRVEDHRTTGSFAAHERSVYGIGSTTSGPVTIDATGTLRLWSLEGDNSRTSRDGFHGAHVPLVVRDDWIFVAADNQIHRTRIEWVEVDDGEDKEGKPKTKKVPQWDDRTPLATADGEQITAIAVGDSGAVAAGTQDGEIYVWPGVPHQSDVSPPKHFSGKPRPVADGDASSPE